MNSLQRVKRSVAGNTIDLFPVFPEVIAFACETLGITQSNYSLDAHTMSDTLLKVRDLCDFDGIYVSRDNLVLHQAVGGEVVFPEDDEPYSPAPVLNSIKQFNSLPFPAPQESPGMVTVLEAASIVRQRVGDSYYIQANIDSGPFEMAGILRGVQNFLLDLLSEEEQLIHKFLSFCTDVVIEYGLAMIDTGVHAIQFGDAVASLISPELYKKFVLPYQKKTVDALSMKGCDIWIHICGNSRHIIPFLKSLNIQGFEVDSAVPLSIARELIGSRIALKGNLDTTSILTRDIEDVYRMTQDTIRSCGFHTGLVVSPGCGVPRMTPLENLRAIVRACRDYRLM